MESAMIKKVKYLSDYKLILTFKNGEKRIYNAEKLVQKDGFIEPLRDIDFFKKVKVKYHTVVWPNGVDLCPDVLYKDSVKID